MELQIHKQWSCDDDSVSSRECDREVSLGVKRGAECNTDNQFLCATVRMAWRCLGKKAVMNGGKRYDMSSLVSCLESDDTGRPL